MKSDFLDKWIVSEAQDRVQVRSYGSELAIMRLSGGELFRPEPVGKRHIVNLLILEGSLTLTANGGRMTLSAPAYIDFIGTHLWTWRNLSTSPDFSGLLLGMTQPFFREIVDALNVKIGDRIFDYMQGPFWPLEPDDAGRLCRMSDLLFESLEKPRHISLRDFLQNLLRSYFCDLMDMLFRQKQLSQSKGSANGRDTLVHFLHLLYNHFQEHHEVKWYADQLCVTPNALSVAVKNTYGRNANRFIDEMLIQKAKQYLTSRKYSVQQVADILNFSDQSAFGKFFKRHCGMSPSAYQRLSGPERRNPPDSPQNNRTNEDKTGK